MLRLRTGHVLKWTGEVDTSSLAERASAPPFSFRSTQNDFFFVPAARFSSPIPYHSRHFALNAQMQVNLAYFLARQTARERYGRPWTFRPPSHYVLVPRHPLPRTISTTTRSHQFLPDSRMWMMLRLCESATRSNEGLERLLLYRSTR